VATPAFMLNPEGVERAYLEALQRNFGGWGGGQEFLWWFRRQVGGPCADLLVLVEGGETLVAGTAVSYRRLDLGGGRKELTGVLTGAWTASQYRRRGCFTELIGRARDVAGRRGAAMMLAFASDDPATREPLARASFAESSTWHTGGEAQGKPADPRAHRPSDAELHRWFHQNRVGAGIEYLTLDVFTEQALLRDPTTRVAEAPGGLWGILAAEHIGGGVQAVISEELAPDPVAVAKALHVWGLPAYTTDPAVAKRLPNARTFLFGLTVSGRDSPPSWPLRWTLHRMDRA
jgi:hypothetical protein